MKRKKLHKGEISVIMLTQEKHVLLAMTHRNSGHSMTTMSAAVHCDNFYSYTWWMEEKVGHIIYQNNAEKIFYLDKFWDKCIFEHVATKCT